MQDFPALATFRFMRKGGTSMRDTKLSFAAGVFLSFSLAGMSLSLEASEGLPSVGSGKDKLQTTRYAPRTLVFAHARGAS